MVAEVSRNFRIQMKARQKQQYLSCLSCEVIYWWSHVVRTFQHAFPDLIWPAESSHPQPILFLVNLRRALSLPKSTSVFGPEGSENGYRHNIWISSKRWVVAHIYIIWTWKSNSITGKVCVRLREPEQIPGSRTLHQGQTGAKQVAGVPKRIPTYRGLRNAHT